MTFGEAHDLMDLLLDKADQPYFTVEEKDKFLNLAYFDWFDKALDRYDADPEIAKCLGKLVTREAGRFEIYSQIFIHTSRNGAQSVPFRSPSHNGTGEADLTDHGTPINSLRSIGRYPFARLLHLQVLYVNEEDGTEDTDWKNVELVKSNEHGLFYNDTSSDPFNKADDDNVKCYMRGAYLEVFPRRLKNGLVLQGWSSMGTDGTSNWTNAGRWRARYISYPIASNVAAGDAAMTSGILDSNDPASWGTRDVQMGSYTYSQQRNSTTGDLEYNDGPVGSNGWGWPMHICNEIVQNAVRLMTSNIEGANYQSQAIEAEQSRSV
tara:strand:+ start:1012 stop:1977 length:966 start_codon:yes stop_codon:yes gene_type:complete